jgi:hypothetical protein
VARAARKQNFSTVVESQAITYPPRFTYHYHTHLKMNETELDALYGPLEAALDASDRELKRRRNWIPCEKVVDKIPASDKASSKVLYIIRDAQSSKALKAFGKKYTNVEPVTVFYAIAITISHPSYCTDGRLLNSRCWEESQGQQVRKKGDVYTEDDMVALRVWKEIPDGDQQRVREDIIRVGKARKAAAKKLKAEKAAAEELAAEKKKRKNYGKKQRQKAKRDHEKAKREIEKAAELKDLPDGTDVDVGRSVLMVEE